MPLSPQDYINQVKQALNQSIIVENWAVLSEVALNNKGHFRARLNLNNGDFLEISEFFQATISGFEPQRYRYQWMDKTKAKLRKRWDNAPHFPEIETFPNHVHVGQEDRVLPSSALSILDLIMILDALL